MIGEGAILMPPGHAFRDIARWIMRLHFSERSFPDRSILIGISSGVFMKYPALPPREDLSWLNPNDALGRRLLRCQPSDEQLYRKFRERFFDTYSRYRKTGVVDVPSDQGPDDQPICEWAARQIPQKEKQSQGLSEKQLNRS